VNNHIKCFKCGSGHYTKDYNLEGPGCFKCGKNGHIFSECGQQKPHFNLTAPRARPTTTGRVYIMTGAEATKNHNLIQGMCFIKGKILIVLYDSSATHSFISNDYVHNLNLSTSFLNTSLVVSTPTSKSVITNQVCLNCSLFINNRKFLVNLVCLPLSQ